MEHRAVCAEEWKLSERGGTIETEVGKTWVKRLGSLTLLHTRGIFVRERLKDGRAMQ